MAASRLAAEVDGAFGEFTELTIRLPRVHSATAEGAGDRTERASTSMTGWVHKDLPRAAPPDSWRSLRVALVPPVDYLDKPPQLSLGAIVVIKCKPTRMLRKGRRAGQ